MADLVSIRECARRIGVSDTAIRKAIAAGRVAVAERNEHNGRPLLDFDDVLKNWRANTDPAMQRTGTSGHGRMNPDALVAGRARTPSGDDGAHTVIDAETGEPIPEYNKSRAAKEFWAAKNAQLAYEREAGTLVLADEVKTEAFRLARALRDAIMAVPDRIDSEMAAETNARKINLRMKDELTKALGRLGPGAKGAA